MVYGPSSKPLVIHRYAASVKCTPSQLTYFEGSSQALTEGSPPHFADVLKLYGPPPPQHAVSAPPVKPKMDMKQIISTKTFDIKKWVVLIAHKLLHTIFFNRNSDL